MTEQVWDTFLTDRDKSVLAASGYGGEQGFGKRPALLVIDVNYAFCGDKREPILESVKRWRNSCGEDAWDALPTLQKTIAAAHEREIPVFYTTGYPVGIRRADNWGSGLWKSTRKGERVTYPPSNHDGNEIMPQIAPEPQDVVVYKQMPSAFFGTDLQSYLIELGCDSLIVTGTTTSGCVRATVLDAFMLHYKVCVVEDGCFDRFEVSHAASLYDMNAKYADVRRSDSVVEFIGTLPKGLFTLPGGTP